MSATKTHTEFYFRPAPMASEALSQRVNLSTTVQSAVRNIEDQTLAPLAGRAGRPATDAKRLLALLAWSYARELYSSAEIHSRLRRGWTAELWEHGIPGADEIKRFRAENRRALETCLQMALRYIAGQKVTEGFVTKFEESHVSAEAKRRIVAAIFIDSLEETGRATS